MKDKVCSPGMKPSHPDKEMKSYKGASAVMQSVPQSIPSARHNSASSPNWVATSFRCSNTYSHWFTLGSESWQCSIQTKNLFTLQNDCTLLDTWTQDLGNLIKGEYFVMINWEKQYSIYIILFFSLLPLCTSNICFYNTYLVNTVKNTGEFFVESYHAWSLSKLHCSLIFFRPLDLKGL